MKAIVEILPYLFMSLWAVFSIYYLVRAQRMPERVNLYMLESIPQIFATIGILGTFVGIAYGLASFDVKHIEESIPTLLDGLRTAFYASIAGILLLIISGKFVEHAQKRIERLVPAEDVVTLRQIAALMTDLTTRMDENYAYTKQIGDKLEAVKSFTDLGTEIALLRQSLAQLSKELTVTIDAGFENLLVQQAEQNTVPLLQKLLVEIDELSQKMDESTHRITEALMTELAGKLEEIVKEFKNSISDSAQKELENITNYLRYASATITEFPQKLQEIMNNMNRNFGDLQEALKRTTREALSENQESTTLMRKQVQEVTDIVKYFYTIYS